MNQTQECKGCSSSVRMSNKEIEVAIERLSKANKIQFVDDLTYQLRLDQCSVCTYLAYGNTCLQCGCIVPIRAKLQSSRCPHPKESKW